MTALFLKIFAFRSLETVYKCHQNLLKNSKQKRVDDVNCKRRGYDAIF